MAKYQTEIPYVFFLEFLDRLLGLSSVKISAKDWYFQEKLHF